MASDKVFDNTKDNHCQISVWMSASLAAKVFKGWYYWGFGSELHLHWVLCLPLHQKKEKEIQILKYMRLMNDGFLAGLITRSSDKSAQRFPVRMNRIAEFGARLLGLYLLFI